MLKILLVDDEALEKSNMVSRIYVEHRKETGVENDIRLTNRCHMGNARKPGGRASGS